MLTFFDRAKEKLFEFYILNCVQNVQTRARERGSTEHLFFYVAYIYRRNQN